MSIILNSSGGGSVTINEPATASNFTHTLPAATGDVMVSGNMPAFSAYLSANQTFSTATTTKAQFNTTRFNLNSNFNTSNYRFTPTVAGYYLVNFRGRIRSSTSNNNTVLYIYKNGSSYGKLDYYPNPIEYQPIQMSALIYMNGLTDYLEIYMYVELGSPALLADVTEGGTEFSAYLTRTA
jgi:hypothetical protein